MTKVDCAHLCSRYFYLTIIESKCHVSRTEVITTYCCGLVPFDPLIRLPFPFKKHGLSTVRYKTLLRCQSNEELMSTVKNGQERSRDIDRRILSVLKVIRDPRDLTCREVLFRALNGIYEFDPDQVVSIQHCLNIVSCSQIVTALPLVRSYQL